MYDPRGTALGHRTRSADVFDYRMVVGRPHETDPDRERRSAALPAYP
jgi:hypothetical protein